ncbi:hypothetical protein G6F42_025953 [Rhizopus arrhizus]|nr:hypothetical protein G6F42_025953 [Rhizopus arrhizus]
MSFQNTVNRHTTTHVHDYDLPVYRQALEKDIYAGIVTSLSFFNDSILLAGHGPYLRVYNVQTGKLLDSKSILPANRIHRIVFGKLFSFKRADLK